MIWRGEKGGERVYFFFFFFFFPFYWFSDFLFFLFSFSSFPPLSSSRVLGFGGGYQGESLGKLLGDFEGAEVVKMDRWGVTCEGRGEEEGEGEGREWGEDVLDEEERRVLAGVKGKEKKEGKGKGKGKEKEKEKERDGRKKRSRTGGKDLPTPPTTPDIEKIVFDGKEGRGGGGGSDDEGERFPHLDLGPSSTSPPCSSPSSSLSFIPSSSSAPFSSSPPPTPTPRPPSPNLTPPSPPPPSPPPLLSSETTKKLVMNNYFSIGVDAEVALKFHRLREEKPQYFK